MRNPGISNRCNPIMAAAVIISLSIACQAAFAAATCPCDIYAAGVTPCVAAHSTVRALYAAYNGPLYQVRRKSDSKTLDIGVLKAGGFANTAAQDSFLSGTTGTISIIYDQSPKGNNLTVAPKGQRGTADVEASATGLALKVGGHAVYAVYVNIGVGYRIDKTSGVATVDQPEGLYMVTSGTHVNGGCCFDYGNAETNNTDDGNGTMEAIYMGTSTSWGHGSGSGPWVMADLENGLFAGGAEVNNNNTPLPLDYVTAMVKGGPNEFAIKGGNAQKGTITTMYSGARPTKAGYNPMTKQGAIILGIGGDNTNSAIGTFFEGAMTTGYPPDTTENAIQANIVAAGYGSSTTPASYRMGGAAAASPYGVHYNSSRGTVVVSYTVQNARRVSMNIVDQSGRQIATIVGEDVSTGRHEALWDAKQVPAGVYACRIAINGRDAWAGKIVIGK